MHSYIECNNPQQVKLFARVLLDANPSSLKLTIDYSKLRGDERYNLLCKLKKCNINIEDPESNTNELRVNGIKAPDTNESIKVTHCDSKQKKTDNKMIDHCEVPYRTMLCLKEIELFSLYEKKYDVQISIKERSNTKKSIINVYGSEPNKVASVFEKINTIISNVVIIIEIHAHDEDIQGFRNLFNSLVKTVNDDLFNQLRSRNIEFKVGYFLEAITNKMVLFTYSTCGPRNFERIKTHVKSKLASLCILRIALKTDSLLLSSRLSPLRSSNTTKIKINNEDYLIYGKAKWLKPLLESSVEQLHVFKDVKSIKLQCKELNKYNLDSAINAGQDCKWSIKYEITNENNSGIFTSRHSWDQLIDILEKQRLDLSNYVQKLNDKLSQTTPKEDICTNRAISALRKSDIHDNNQNEHELVVSQLTDKKINDCNIEKEKRECKLAHINQLIAKQEGVDDYVQETSNPENKNQSMLLSHYLDLEPHTEEYNQVEKYFKKHSSHVIIEAVLKVDGTNYNYCQDKYFNDRLITQTLAVIESSDNPLDIINDHKIDGLLNERINTVFSELNHYHMIEHNRHFILCCKVIIDKNNNNKILHCCPAYIVLYIVNNQVL